MSYIDVTLIKESATLYRIVASRLLRKSTTDLLSARAHEKSEISEREVIIPGFLLRSCEIKIVTAV